MTRTDVRTGDIKADIRGLGFLRLVLPAWRSVGPAWVRPRGACSAGSRSCDRRGPAESVAPQEIHIATLGVLGHDIRIAPPPDQRESLLVPRSDGDH